MSVAVVIPLFNHARYIREAIQSCMDQSLVPDRIFVIDDGSSDDSVSAVREMASPLVELVVQENQGAHVTINRGVAMAADFEYVAILNSDDRFLPDRIAQCVQLMEASRQTQLLCTRLRLIDGDGVLLDPESGRGKWFREAWSVRESPLNMVEQIATVNFPCTTSNFFARTAWLMQHPFRNYRYAHDYFHLMEAVMDDALEILDEPLLDYRVHTTNTISTAPENLVLEMQRLNLDFARHLASRLAGDEKLRENYATYCRRAWRNRSSFRADTFAVFTAIALSQLTEEQLAEAWRALDPGKWPELKIYPNVSVPPDTLDASAGEQLAALKIAHKMKLALGDLQTLALRSRWLALGRLIGVEVPFDPPTPGQWQSNSWVRLGEQLGSKRLRAIRQLLSKL